MSLFAIHLYISRESEVALRDPCSPLSRAVATFVVALRASRFPRACFGARVSASSYLQLCPPPGPPLFGAPIRDRALRCPKSLRAADRPRRLPKSVPLRNTRLFFLSAAPSGLLESDFSRPSQRNSLLGEGYPHEPYVSVMSSVRPKIESGGRR